MRLIGLSVWSGLWLAVCCLAAQAAVVPETPVQAIAGLASDLSQGDVASAIARLDPRMAEYNTIRAYLDALVAQTEISCAIDVVTDEEAGGVHTLDLDWLMGLKTPDSNKLERRRERVRVEMREVKGKWIITAFSPLTIVSPIRVQ